MSLWKERGIIGREQLENIQNQVNDIQVPASIGRIPHKIISNFSGFTADQWKNWICIYSTVCLHNLLSIDELNCWSNFQDACCLMVQPSISVEYLKKIDEKLLAFCTKYEAVYGKANCTPNMHMHLHLCKCIENYGPPCSFWCFPFERFNGILGGFQSNWIAPEQQMANKFLTYQKLLTVDVSKALPLELQEFFGQNMSRCGHVSVGEGSLEQSHVDSLSLLHYKRNATCSVCDIDASENVHHDLSRIYERWFTPSELTSLRAVYGALYPSVSVEHIPMVHECFHELKVFHETFRSTKSRGNHSSGIAAYWAGVGGNISLSNDHLRIGVIQYFFRHTVTISPNPTQSKRIAHIFAYVHWYRSHWRESWFHPRVLVVQPDMDTTGPATILPIARVFSRCALQSKTVQFDYGEDNVMLAILCSSNYSI